jgi:2-succinyl-6-hydroxy-2,4-cyclohexadiene-1-carboxylate synthase
MARVVLVPGFTQTAASWAGVAEIVAASCDTIAIDVPARETIDATVNAIAKRGNRGVYVGYSMGGRLALRLALDRPDFVRALVLVSSSPGIANPEERAARVASDEELAQSIARVGVSAFIDDWLAQPLFAGVPDGAPGVADRKALTAGYLAHCLRVLGNGAFAPMWGELRNLTMPVALVTGTHDEKYDAIAQQMLERIPTSVVHVRLDGGHALPLENPAVLGGFIAAFADEHG